MKQRTIRIFISSPGDVTEERDRARRVIGGLQRRYSAVVLEAVLWEELPLPATASFQETIDVVLKRHPIDVAVFILWSRLGSPLGPAVTRADGSPYRSGTEREFDLMLAAFEQSGRKRPIILAYTRDDDAAFKKKFPDCPNDKLQQLLDQRTLAEAFILERFYDKEGHNLRAMQSYREPVGFAQRLEMHLRQAFDDLLGTDAGPAWLEEPYRGLEVFDVRHSPIFYGRDEEICNVLQRLRDQGQAGCAFVVIVGASGSGKSSLARAGVAASLLRDTDDAVREWRLITFAPSLSADDLLIGLVQALANTLGPPSSAFGSVADVANDLARDAELTVRLCLRQAFAQAAEQAQGPLRVLLVLDQMEELWTDRRVTKEDRERFLAVIEALARSGHIAVLATLRSDFYSHAQTLPAFVRLKGEHGHVDLLPPNTVALQRLITEPARLAGVRFEQHKQSGLSLDEVILRDAARDLTALPLLQYTLAELYRQRDESRRIFTFAAYRALGGVEGALGRRAEETFAALPEDARAAFADVLPLLVTVDISPEQTAMRRRAPLADLTETAARRTLIETLINARFMATDRQGETAVASLAHEALLRRWPRIAEWITQNREHLRMRARVEQSQQRWEQHDRDDSLLLPIGLPLEEARQILHKALHLLTPGTRNYVASSIRFYDRKTQQSRRIRRVITTALATLAILAMLGGIVAWTQQHEAERQREIADLTTAEATRLLKQEYAARTRAQVEERRATLAAEAERNAKDAAMAQHNRAENQLYLAQIQRAAAHLKSRQHNQARTALATIPLERRQWETNYLFRQVEGTPLAVSGHGFGWAHIAFSPDSQKIACCFGLEPVAVVNSKSGTVMFILERAATQASFSPDGKQIVTASGNEIFVWDAQMGRLQLAIRGHEKSVNSVAYSPDGERIVSGSADRTIRVWDARTGDKLFSCDAGNAVGADTGIVSTAFCPEGKKIASASSGRNRAGNVSIWDAVSGERLLYTQPHKGKVSSVAFSPDGSRLASAGVDRIVKVLDTETGTEMLSLTGHETPVNHVAFSPDGRQIVSGSGDMNRAGGGEVRLWDSATGKETIALRGHEAAVTSVAFSPDGRRIASAGTQLLGNSYFGSELKVWNIESEVESVALLGHDHSVTCVAVSPNSRQVASGDHLGKVVVWDIITGTAKYRVGHLRPVTAVAFSPDGRLLATSSWDSTIRIWDAHTGQSIKTLRGHEDGVSTIAFSPGGSRIASGSNLVAEEQFLQSSTGEVRVWDIAMETEITTFSTDVGSIDTLCFIPDSQWIVIGGGGSVAGQPGHGSVWDVHSGEMVLTLEGHEHAIVSVAVSSNGQQIVTGSGDKTAKIWDVASGKDIQTLVGHDDTITSVAFSPDGRRIVTGSEDQAIKLWDTETGAESLSLRGHTGGTRGVTFSRNGRLIASGGADKAVKVWDAAVPANIALLRGHKWRVCCVALCPDRRRVASGDTDGTVQIWDTEYGAEIFNFDGHRGRINSLAFSRDCQWLASGSGDSHRVAGDQDARGEVRVWDVETGQELWILHGDQPITGVSFSTDGRRLLSRDSAGDEKIWDATTGASISGEALPNTLGEQTGSADSLLQVVPNMRDILLIRKNPNYDPWAEEAARREAWEPIWCERDAAQCEAAENWFAACVHLRRLTELKPDDPSLRTRLKNAEAALAAEREASETR